MSKCQFCGREHEPELIRETPANPNYPVDTFYTEDGITYWNVAVKEYGCPGYYDPEILKDP